MGIQPGGRLWARNSNEKNTIYMGHVTCKAPGQNALTPPAVASERKKKKKTDLDLT